MKLRTKIILYFILPIFLFDLLVGAYNLYGHLKIIKDLSERKFYMDTKSIADEISKTNMQGVTISGVAAAAAGDIGFGRRAASVSYIRDLLIKYPSYMGASISYEPNADGMDEKSLIALNNIKAGRATYENGGEDSYNFAVNKTYTDINTWIEKSMGGRLVAYWIRKGPQLALEPLEGMDTLMYGAGLKKKVESGSGEQFIITEPYMYKDTELMIEYSAPILLDGRYSGQVGIDSPLSYIHDMLAKLKTFDTSEFFLISRFDRVIVSTIAQDISTVSVDDLYVDERGNFLLDFLKLRDGQFVRDTAAASSIDFSKYSTVYRDLLRSMIDDDSAGTKKVRTFKDSRTGKLYCIAYCKIMPAGWLIVQIVPVDKIHAPLYEAVMNEAFSVAIFFFALLLVVFLLRKFTRNIERATAASELIAQGDLRENLDETYAGKDEVGRLIVSMNKMTASLRALINGVKGAAGQLGTATTGMETASLDYESRVHDFGSSTGQIASSVKGITAASGELYRTVSRLAQAAADSADTADSGRKHLSSMERTMASLEKNTQVIARSLGVINQKAKNINSVVTTISKVADETNLLSLNAAIEAEKAGSYGIGFAVVAKEIGRLADQTAMATSDIDAIVNDMQSSVGAGVAEMNKFSEEVRVGVVEVGRIILGMDSIITQMQEVAPQLEHITEGMQAQAHGASQLSGAVSNLNESAKQTESLLGEFALARDLLHRAILNLRDEISKFRLGK